MLEKFFATNQNTSNMYFVEPPITLLSGPRSSGKTSLLFQYAINCASESCRDVVFICSKTRFESNPPFLSQGLDPSSEVLRRIQMKYIEDEDGIKKYFAAFHLHKSFPVAVVVDDFGDYFGERSCQERYDNARGRDLAMSRTLALCYDAVMYAKMLQQNESCNLVLADTHLGDSPRLLFIYKRWAQCIFTIQDNGSGSLTVRSAITSYTKSRKTRAAQYSTALQYLVLEEILEE